MLTSRITLPISDSPSQEDIFSSAIGTLFTDDTHNSHGSPGGSLTYASPAFGDIELRIPAHPDVEDGRKLFAHYLWNAGILVAEGVERGSLGATAGENSGDRRLWDSRWWDVNGRRVLELGAGTALPSIICALSGAANVTITDHPSSPALVMGAIQANVTKNLPPTKTNTEVTVRGYVWGTENTYLTDAYGRVAGKLDKYDKIIAADCLWMPSQHENLVRTVAQALDRGPGRCAIVVAGFHTGRGIVRDFFDVATGRLDDEAEATGGNAGNRVGADVSGVDNLPRLRVEDICEVGVDGQRREWQRVRPGEIKEEAKRWCVVAVLVQP